MRCVRILLATSIVSTALADTTLAQAVDKKPPIPFTDAQAVSGQMTFTTSCAGCHGVALDSGPGGPPLKGLAFRARWQSQDGDALYTYILTKMPPGSPTPLDPTACADLVAYIVKSNGGTAGTTPLPADPSQLATLSLAGALPPLPAGPVAPMLDGAALAARVPLQADAVSMDAQKRLAERMQRLPLVTDDMLKNPPQGSWLNWRRTYDAQGFSPLAQINRNNATRLKLGWTLALPPGQAEVTPLVHEGIMFLASNGHVLAIDATTGDLLWQYTRDGGGGVMRNIAIYADRLFLPAGGSVVALNMRTGAVIWDHAVGGPMEPIRFSGGPIVARGKVILGNVGGGPGGPFLVALDADTGKEAWRFYTIARPGQPGGNSWNGAPLDERTGGSVWIAGSYDAALDLVYFGTAQTYKIGLLLDNFSGASGSNDGLYTDTTLALRPDTGELVWHYQHTNREVWDLDWAFERTLATLKVRGQPRRTVTTAGKLGIFDTLDAATGEYLFSYDIGVQNLVARIDPTTGAKQIASAMEPKANVEQFVCPSNVGGRDWPSTALNPTTGTLYVPLSESCMAYMWRPGAPSGDFLRPPAHRKDSDGMVGRVQAFELATGKTLWVRRRRAHESSAILATAGGLIFEGSNDRWFRASDDRTGKVLWQFRLDNTPSSFPISYSVDGVQYIAVVTGTGSPLEITLGSLTPEIIPSIGGTTLWTFRVD
jgi:alcohol dehydrogenase (cytochrome c)